ncbi:quinone oxidoreductase [Flammeovirga sp. EKP202]|uniref:quinone oxidoreductase family protein n=1 Tax=Flammeovirga sp. EKP202 TaxID=2770592 RepID=UPI00165ECEB8|nr:quinone oxidoreductase [Flammeovirga sp. EKP202]MBD0404003.1 quinone oxidoreductase [Flammeovirga sp. EKP202]
MKALTFSSFGGPEVLDYIEVQKPEIKTNEVLVENKVIGLNFADIYRRKGNYHLKGQPPFIAGYEGAGVVVESKSDLYKVGDRIAYTDVPFANAEFIVVPEEHAIPISEKVNFSLAATVLLQGLTAHYLANDSYQVKHGETVLIHAASGGVGQILSQICKSKGATVIGLTRSENKLQTILDTNADHAIQLDDNWLNKVIEITDGNGVDVVYDSVGATIMDSFEVTKDTGTVVFYGMSGGDPVAIDPRMLMDTSKTLTGGYLWSYLVNHEERMSRANALFELIEKGIVKIKEPVTFKLSDGKKAHEYLEGGQSSSKVLLVP